MRRALAAVVVGVALIAGACGNGDGDGSASGDLPLLPSGGGVSRATSESAKAADAAGAAPAAGDAATSMIAPGEPYRPIEYRLADGIERLGGKAAAYRLDAGVDEASVAKLARAFGLDAKPRQDGTAWQVGDVKAGGSWLSVDVSGMFTYVDEVAQGMTERSEVAVACAPDAICSPPASPVTAPPPAKDLPSDKDATARAEELLRAAGVNTDDLTARVERSDQVVSVALTASVGGTPVEGWGYAVAIGDKGALQYVSGALARPSKVGDYPLVDTKAAFDRWHNGMGGGVTTMEGGASSAGAGSAGMSEPAVDSPATDSPAADPKIAPAPAPVPPSDGRPAGSPPVTLEPQIVEIDRAEMALTVEYGRCPGDPMYLVPAYRLYAGDQLTAVVPAVADEYLAAGQDGDTAVSSDDSSSKSTSFEPCPGTEPGQTEPGREPDSPPVTG